MSVKKAYFQGGGGVNEPTPGEKKYKSDPALVVQPRFEEPFYRNYDLYTIPGMEHIGPGTGYHGLQNYDSVQEFLEARRSRMEGRYVADDSWQIDSGARVKKNPNIKARAAIFERIIKTARMPGMGLFHSLHRKFKNKNTCGFCGKSKIDVTFDCEHCGKGGPVVRKKAGPNYDLGKGLYQEMSDGKIDSVEEFRKEPDHGPGALMNITKKKNNKYDINHIDFPIDDQVTGIYPEEGVLPGSEIGEKIPLTEHDLADRSPEALNFGRDYDNEDESARGLDDDILQKLFNKYLAPSDTGLFGLPDGVDPEGHDAEPLMQVEQPFTGTSDIGTNIYEDKWNI